MSSKLKLPTSRLPENQGKSETVLCDVIIENIDIKTSSNGKNYAIITAADSSGVVYCKYFDWDNNFPVGVPVTLTIDCQSYQGAFSPVIRDYDILPAEAKESLKRFPLARAQKALSYLCKKQGYSSVNEFTDDAEGLCLRRTLIDGFTCEGGAVMLASRIMVAFDGATGGDCVDSDKADIAKILCECFILNNKLAPTEVLMRIGSESSKESMPFVMALFSVTMSNFPQISAIRTFGKTAFTLAMCYIAVTNSEGN